MWFLVSSTSQVQALEGRWIPRRIPLEVRIDENRSSEVCGC